jgi:hypothetical protein
MRRGPYIVIASLLAAAAITLAAVSSSSAAPARPKALTPVVLFPAFHFTKLEVIVRNQIAARGCPPSGSFEDYYQNPHPPASPPSWASCCPA